MMGDTSRERQHWNGNLVASSLIENDEEVPLAQLGLIKDTCCNSRNSPPPNPAPLPPIHGIV